MVKSPWLPPGISTGFAALAAVISVPLIVTLATPASALTVIVPCTVAPLASSTLLSATVNEPSTSSTIITGGASA